MACAHGEWGKVGRVERVIRFAAEHADVAFVERQRDQAGQILLRGFYEGVQSFAQRREPQAKVNEFGILERDVLLEMQQVPIEAEGFEFPVGGEQQRASWRFVAAARLDADEAVLDQVDASNRVAPADFVQQFDQRYGIESLAAHRNTHASFESDFNLFFVIGSD